MSHDVDQLHPSQLAYSRLRNLILRLGRGGSIVAMVIFSTLISMCITAAVTIPLSWGQPIFWIGMGLGTVIPIVVSLLVAAPITYLVFEIEDARLHVEQLAMRDPTTGVYNRRHFFHVGERQFTQRRRLRQTLSLLLLDIDDFKLVNDRHGHEVGDRVLTEVAHVCRESVGEEDLVARYGGEEFVILLVSAGLVEARRAAERIRKDVAELVIDDGTILPGARATVSIGIATLSSMTSTFDDLLAQADRCMYAAKRSGKNRVSSGPWAAA